MNYIINFKNSILHFLIKLIMQYLVFYYYPLNSIITIIPHSTSHFIPPQPKICNRIASFLKKNYEIFGMWILYGEGFRFPKVIFFI